MSDSRYNGARREPGAPSSVEQSDATPMPAAPPRNVAFERRWTTLAAATVNADAEKLIHMAEARADGPGFDPHGDPNHARRALENLADARNHICWWAAQAVERAGNDELAGEITEAIAQALAATALAFYRADHARGLLLERLGAQR